MSQQELLRRVVASLERAGIDYMVTGSVVSSLQGEPRSTHDIDFVVAVDQARVPSIVSAFPPPRFYLDEQAARQAVRSRGMFNLIDTQSGDKVDFWLLTDEPFDRSRFARRYQQEVFGIRLALSTPEDTILQKLKWAKLSGGSEKAFVDALRVFEVQAGILDPEYLESWVGRLGVGDLWKQLRSEAEET
ncbi:MAG TPA: hypothetical protein VF615_28905 [Longimicrobiaceae bacterium]|jgi:hypothetical protein